MRIFNSVNKTKYFIALALLLALALFVASIDTAKTFINPVNPNFSVKSNALFNCADMHTGLIAPKRMWFFCTYECTRGLKQHHSVVRQEKVLPATKLSLEKYVNNVYATARISYYAEVCKLLAQLIVIYMFMTDGKKRSLKFICIQLITNEILYEVKI